MPLMGSVWEDRTDPMLTIVPCRRPCLTVHPRRDPISAAGALGARPDPDVAGPRQGGGTGLAYSAEPLAESAERRTQQKFAQRIGLRGGLADFRRNRRRER